MPRDSVSGFLVRETSPAKSLRQADIERMTSTRLIVTSYMMSFGVVVRWAMY
ncbi:hypothetical protein AB0K52_09070 [Glycomyces sp. NPDC049804]|uniref:hypothetical protein n=1 Tax=Glycomyces sp. NPDC049804 TaxID=3154363 RepID=UPI003446DE4A